MGQATCEDLHYYQQTLQINDADAQAPLADLNLSVAWPPVKLPPEPDRLVSAKNIDYTRLRDLLAAGQWKKADQETARVMLQAVGREASDWIRPEELLNFPCEDLRTIDRLWVKYSQGRFGFSVQKQIYLTCGAQPNGKYPGDKIWKAFCT